jgi:hypothetical protein
MLRTRGELRYTVCSIRAVLVPLRPDPTLLIRSEQLDCCTSYVYVYNGSYPT